MERYRKLLQDVLNIDVVYIPISTPGGGPIHPERFCSALRGMNAIGGAISRDIKAAVVPYLDEVEPFAQKVGSVNTVIRRGDKLVGYNLDAHGFRKAVDAGVQDSGHKITNAVVYGYGGVTNVVVYCLQELGYSVFLTGRRPEEARRRAAELSCAALIDAPKGTQLQLLINAAPVTEKPLEEAVGMLEAFQLGVKVVFDHEMPGAKLKEYCEANGVHHIPGIAMYYPQMYRQWTLFLEGFATEEEIPALIAKAEGSSA